MGFSGSRALSDALGLVKGRFGPMLGVSILYYVLLVAAMALLGGGVFAQIMAMGPNANPAALGADFGLTIFLLYLVIYALQFFHQAALMRLCSDRHEASLGEAISAGIRSVPTLLGVAVLVIIGAFGVILVFFLVTAAVMAATQSGGLSFVLSLLMLVGFGYLGMRLSMILPVVANEDQRNPITAISRSWAMTKGSALKLFLLFVLVIIVMGVIGLALFMMTLGMPQPGSVPGMGSIVALGIAMLLYGLTLGLYFIALIAAVHNQLSGPGVEAMQDTFA